MFQATLSSPPIQPTRISGLVSRRTMVVLVLACLVAGVKTLVDVYLRSNALIEYTMTDIDTFWLVGWLYWDGRLADAYSAAALFAAQSDVLNTQSFMPFTYPPQFNFLTVALGAVPIWLAYALFVPLTLALYLVALRGLSAATLGLVFVLVFPAILVNIRTGQNGFLIAGLVALSARAIIAPNLRGGFALGLAAIKPHIAIGIGAAALLAGQWRLAGLAIATCLFTLGAAAAVFGTDLFPLTLSASQEAMGFLRQGAYPLHRMVSVYSFVRSFGASADVALFVQAASACLTCACLLLLALRGTDRVVFVAAAVVAPLFISPYAYDYDMTLAGISFALIAPRIVPRARPSELIVLLVMAWVATGWGIPVTFLREWGGEPVTTANLLDYPSIQAIFNLAMVVFVARLLRRPATPEKGVLA